jgi:ABC-type transporter Mla subunit MlaD
MTIVDSFKALVVGLQALPQILKEIQDLREQLKGMTGNVNEQMTAVTERLNARTDTIFLELKGYTDTLNAVKTQLDSIMANLPKLPFR